jgi:hypothetical protein
LAEVEAEKTNIKNERLPIEKKIGKLEEKVAELQRDGPVDQLFLLEAEIETVKKELKYALRHLQKSFKKMQALALYRGGAGLTPDERNKLGQYLEKPFKALSTEKAGYPLLKQILQKLVRLMNEDKLKLKSDKKRKAERAINEILKRDSLAKIYNKCAELALQERQILNSAKMEEIKNNISVFQAQTKRLKRRKARIEAHEAVKEHAYNAIVGRIRGHKRTIKKNIYNSIGQKIQIL